MPDKDAVALRLAEAHYNVEPGISEIFRLTAGAEAESSPGEPIKLLEINSNTIAVGVMPLNFGPLPRHGIDFRSVIVEVSPDEFDQIRSRELPLPDGWEIGELMPRPSANGTA